MVRHHLPSCHYGDMDRNDLLAIWAALAEAGVEYAVVGGIAVNLHGLVRATEDVDLFVRPDPENIERLRRALHSLYDDASIDEIRSEDLAGPYPAIRYVPPGDASPIDLLARLGTAFGYADLEIQTYRVGNIPVRVATPATLYLMKHDTVRVRDREDAARLQQAFGLDSSDAAGEDP